MLLKPVVILQDPTVGTETILEFHGRPERKQSDAGEHHQDGRTDHDDDLSATIQSARRSIFELSIRLFRSDETERAVAGQAVSATGSSNRTITRLAVIPAAGVDAKHLHRHDLTYGQRQQADGRGPRSQRTRPPAVSQRFQRGVWERALLECITIVIDQVDGR